MPVEIGDLVGFYRRKTPGMGIILEKIDDILEHCGVDQDIAFSIVKNAQGKTHWEKRSAIEELCGGVIENSRMLHFFIQYNNKWCSKPKTTFVKIKWFKPPFAYDGRLTENEGWYPADWVRSK